MNTSNKLTDQEFSIEGLSCSNCASSAQKLLNTLDGVASASVDFERKTAKISYETDRIKPEQFKTALDQLGYQLIIENPTEH